MNEPTTPAKRPPPPPTPTASPAKLPHYFPPSPAKVPASPAKPPPLFQQPSIAMPPPPPPVAGSFAFLAMKSPAKAQTLKSTNLVAAFEAKKKEDLEKQAKKDSEDATEILSRYNKLMAFTSDGKNLFDLFYEFELSHISSFCYSSHCDWHRCRNHSPEI